MAEQVLRDCAKGYGFKTVALRYFNACGADSRVRHGQLKAATHVIARIMETIVNKGVFTLNGTDYPTADGTCIRDYVHIQDVVSAHLLIASRLVESKLCGEIFNIGSGIGTSVTELFNEIKKVSHSNIDPVIAPRRNGDLPRIVADIAKLQSWTGWKPTRGLTEIVSSSWDAFEAGQAR